jgi:hypothetical protein
MVHNDSATCAQVAVRAVAALVVMKLDVLVVLVVGVEDVGGDVVESGAGCSSTGLGLSNGNCSRTGEAGVKGSRGVVCEAE